MNTVDRILDSPKLKRFLVGRAMLNIPYPALDLRGVDGVPVYLRPYLACASPGPIAVLNPKGATLCRALRDAVLERKIQSA